MHKPETIQENETHIILWDFEIQTDPLILTRRPDLVIVKKKVNLPNSALCCPSGPQSEKREKKKETQVLRPYQRIQKLWNIKVTGIPIVICALRIISKGLVRGMEEVEIRGRTETIQTTDKIGHNTEKSLRDLKRLVVTQTPLKDHQLMLM